MSRYYINVRKPKVVYEPETLAFQLRVIEDGGKILDIEKLDNFYKANKAIDKYDALQFAVSKQFGYKLNGSGNIIKIYDASKNGNDLEISRGEVPEDLENDMFFLDNTFFKDETVTFDTIGDKFTFVTDINHPNPKGKAVNYFAGFGEIWLYAGGSVNNVNNFGYLTTVGGTQRYISENGSYDNDDAGLTRRVSFLHGSTNKILKDGINQGTYENTIQGRAFNNPIVKIIYGGRSDENISSDADCYLNDSFFYNNYLTDEELEIINGI